MNFIQKKPISLIIFVIVLAVVGVYIYLHLDKNNFRSGNIISYKDPGLTQQEKDLFSQKIEELKKQLSTVKDDQEKFKLNMQIGFQYYGLGEYGLARKQYLIASKILPENPTAWAELYVIENAMQDYKNAKTHILKAISLDPSSSQYWRWRIDLERQGLAASTKTLDQLFTEALGKTNNSVDIITLYAKYLEEQKNDLRSAIMQWRKAAELNPDAKDQYEGEIKRIQNTLR